MTASKFVSYYRVSTARQGQSGLGLEAQRASVAAYLNGGSRQLVGEFQEIESAWKGGKGVYSLDKRPHLRAALDLCRKEKATLLVAVLDRFARNVNFISGMMETNVPFVSLEMPTASPFELHIRAAVAEEESRKISERTRAAMRVAKDRGVQFGVAGIANLRPVLEQRKAGANQFATRMRGVLLGFQARGLSQRRMVDELNALGVPSARGGRWHLLCLQLVLARLAPEQRVRDLAAQLRRDGYTVKRIVVELAKRGVFAIDGTPYTAPTVSAMLKAA